MRVEQHPLPPDQDEDELQELAGNYLRVRNDMQELQRIEQSLQVGRFHHSAFADLVRCRRRELQVLISNFSKADLSMDDKESQQSPLSPLAKSFQRLVSVRRPRTPSTPAASSDATKKPDEDQIEREAMIQDRSRQIEALEQSMSALDQYLHELDARCLALGSSGAHCWPDEACRIHTQLTSALALSNRFPEEHQAKIKLETAQEAWVTADQGRRTAWAAHACILRASQFLRCCSVRLEGALKQNRIVKSTESITRVSTRVLQSCRTTLFAAAELSLHASHTRNPTEKAAERELALSNELESIADFINALLTSRQFSTTSEKVRLLAVVESVTLVAGEPIQQVVRGSMAKAEEATRVLDLAAQHHALAQEALEEIRQRIFARLAGMHTGQGGEDAEEGAAAIESTIAVEELPPYSPSSPLASFY